MEIVVFLVGAAVVAVISIGVGMLLAPRLERLGAPPEPADADTRPDAKP